MANYPIKMLKDENNTPFVPLVGANAIIYNDTETLEEKLNKKLEKQNIIAGDNITLDIEGNNITINGGAGSSIELIDNTTTSESGVGALDAHQGKVLKEMIPNVINDVTSTSETDALSAKQGYNLNRNKQDTLVSGTNIKTINNQSLLGSGNITISDAPEGVFLCTYGTTTYADAIAAYNDGKSLYCKYENESYGDVLIPHTMVRPNGMMFFGGVVANGTYSCVKLAPNGTWAMVVDLGTFTQPSDLETLQDKLVSGTNIKTINSQSILGSGNMEISGGAEIPIQDNPPENPEEGDLWIDSNEQQIVGANVRNEYSTSQTDTYSCNYVNNMITPNEINKNIVIEDTNTKLIDLVPSSMTIASTTEYTTKSTSAEKLYCELRYSVGNKLIYDSVNGNIKIGAGVSYIKVSANITIKTPSVANGRHQLYVYKNDNYIASSVIRANGTNTYQSICITPMLDQVSENDVISLYVRSQDGAGAVTYALARACYLTVEVVE